MRAVLKEAKGTLERTYSRWVVLSFIFSDIGRDLKRVSRQFETVMRSPKKYPKEVAEIERLITPVVLAAVKFYRTRAVESGERLDPNTFFQRRGQAKDFSKYWTSAANSRREPFNNAKRRLLRSLEAIEV
jgi:hypothetical protein